MVLEKLYTRIFFSPAHPSRVDSWRVLPEAIHFSLKMIRQVFGERMRCTKETVYDGGQMI
jgi:hypothetical protein